MTRPMGVIPGMSFEEYHAVDALSSTGLRIFARSPWHYRNRVQKIPTRAMLRGSLAHCAVLEPDAMASRYVVVPADAPKRPTDAQWGAAKSNASSQAAKDWWIEWNAKAGGRVIVPAADYAITEQQLQALRADETITQLLANCSTEVSVFWVDKATGVYCKARPDCVAPVDARTDDLMDLKSARDESPAGFGRIAAAMGYHLQAAHYSAGWEAAARRKVGRFVLAAVTSAPPVLAVPYVLTDEIRDQAADERAELLERFAWCQREDRWPTYGAGVQLLDFPAYAKRSGEVDVEWAAEA